MATRRVPRRSAEEDVDEDPVDDEDEYEDEDEPEEEEPPRRASSGRGNKPPPRRAVAADEDDDDGEPAPRRGLKKAAATKKAAPKKAAASTKKAAPSRRRAEEDDDEEADDGEADDGEAVVGAGWGAYSQIKQEIGSDFPDQLQATEEKTLFKFLEDHPFATFGQHWADWLSKGSKLSYLCLAKTEKGCPLCDLGDKPQLKVFFNVLDLTDPDNPKVKILSLGQRNAETVAAFNSDKKLVNGEKKVWPINATDRYFSLQKTGTRQRTNIVIASVKARDVEEDWEIAPFNREELKPFMAKVFDTSAIPRSPRSVLEEVAEKYGEDD